MALDHSTDALLDAAREDADLPDWEEADAQAELLRLMNRQQRLELTALLLKAKAEHRQATFDVELEDGTLRYDLPARAVAAGLVQVKALDASGNLVSTVTLFPSAREGERQFIGGPGQAYLEGNQLVLYGAAAGVGTLRFVYNRRLSELVLLEHAAVITAIDTGTGVVAIGTRLDHESATVTASAPSGFGTAAALYDFVKPEPHFDIRAMDKSATRSSTNMTFDPADLPDGLAVGDFVCRAGTSPVCQAPLELHPVLTARTAYRAIKSKGDPAAAALKEDVATAERLAMEILAPRVEGQLTVITNTNGPGWRRMGRSWRR